MYGRELQSYVAGTVLSSQIMLPLLSIHSPKNTNQFSSISSDLQIYGVPNIAIGIGSSGMFYMTSSVLLGIKKYGVALLN